MVLVGAFLEKNETRRNILGGRKNSPAGMEEMKCGRRARGALP
jgi:hypothetical protein